MHGACAGPGRNRTPRANLLILVLLSCGCQRGTAPEDPATGSKEMPDSGPDVLDAAGARDLLDTGAAPDLSNPPAGAEAGVPPRAKSATSVFVHLFEWRWVDIAAECEEFLGPRGFTAVQVSPPSEHALIAGRPWWQRYQTVAYTLDRSRSGTGAEFADMVSRCARAGVGIYVDAVVNHMTGQTAGLGSNGTRFTKYEYPGLYGAADFHAPTCSIEGADYQTDAHRVQSCELVGLADLDTGKDVVQTRIAAYLSALVRVGVAGFRIDAAKHMAPADIDAILSKVSAATAGAVPPYYFLEVIDYGGEAVHATDYVDVGKNAGVEVDITEFKYSGIDDAFLNRGGKTVSTLKTVSAESWGLLATDRAVVFTNNHDTQRGTAIFYQDGASHDLANVFLLAWPYGYPSIMSSFAFDRSTGPGRDSGPPSDAQGNTNAIYASASAPPACAAGPATARPGDWVCEHRARSVANMVAFRRVAGTAPVQNLWDDGGNRLAFGRGDRGFVVLNRDPAAFTRRFQTGLQQGTYCDVIRADFTPAGCPGAEVTVDAAGMADITVAANAAAALHAEAMR
jgi:alpha-amylase